MGLELMKISGPDPDTVEETRSMVERQARHMVRLIDDLLDVSRIMRGKLGLRKSRVELKTIVDQAIEATRPLLQAADHHLVVRLPQERVMLEADRDRLTQVLSNLLNNAAKYTAHGGRIELTAMRHEDEVSIRVTDNGRGISAQQLSTIFDMFIQASGAADNGHSGLGIGLTLVKSLVEMHGGCVDVQSAGPGQGSTFLVRLPALLEKEVESTLAEPSSATPPARDAAARRVLLVDDNLDSLEAMTRLVTVLGHEAHVAHDGLEAISVAEQCRPDVILMDLGMPRMNGYDAACEIRARSWGGQVRLVAVTGWGQAANRQRTKAAGFDDHLVKPLSAETLLHALAGSDLRESRAGCPFDGAASSDSELEPPGSLASGDIATELAGSRPAQRSAVE